MTAPHPRLSKPVFEDLGNGVTREWIDNERIVVYSASESARRTVDTLFADVRRMMTAADVRNPPGILYDFSAPNVGVTPYANQQGKLVLAHRPELYAYVAIIIRNSFMGAVIKLYVNSLQQLARDDAANLRVFYRREDGITWMRERTARYVAKHYPTQAGEPSDATTAPKDGQPGKVPGDSAPAQATTG